MPSIAAHMVCAKLVSNKLNINDSEFIKGNILPDIIDENDSHKRIKGKHYCIPDIEYFINTLDLNNNLHLGYLTHLLLDKYYLDDYIYDVACGDDVFLNRIIYKEYSSLNYELLQKFELNIEDLNNILRNFGVDIDYKKYDKNIKNLNNTELSSDLTYLNIEDFSEFLIETSTIISEYLLSLK